MKKMKNLSRFACALSVLSAALSCGKTPADDNSSMYLGDKLITDQIRFSDGKQDIEGMEIGKEKGGKILFTGKQSLPKGTYQMNGWVYIGEGAELTIAPGTVIKGGEAAALIVEQGGKLHASGNADAPIVFTSLKEKGQRKPGDWGGIILCGRAENNGQSSMNIEGGVGSVHGGKDNEDSSGELQYVRIEFCGYPFMKDKEINGLTLGSVGSGTVIDHIQVSYSCDDSYEWFGGCVNAEYLVSFRTWDDDFDTDNGYSGNVRYGLAIRDSKIADGSQANCFESDNDSNGSDLMPITKPLFQNMTFVGPFVTDPAYKCEKSYIDGGGMMPSFGADVSVALGLHQAAMHIRRGSQLSCEKSVALGFPVGIILDNEKGEGKTQSYATSGEMHISDCIIALNESASVLGSDANKVYEDYLVTAYKPEMTFDKSRESFSSSYFKAAGNSNSVFVGWKDLVDATGYIPASGSPLLEKGIGAFDGKNNWLDKWTNFDPQNTDY